MKEQFIEANGLTFCFEARGNPCHEPVLLVMGLGAQMTLWPPELIQALVDQGYYVIRFDNRDIGRSTELSARIKQPIPLAFTRFRLGLPVDAAYTLHDMADDAVALLDALGLSQAHIVGASMGGMISQIIGVTHAKRVKSLTLIMTSNNSPKLPLPDIKTLWYLNGGGIKGHSEEAVIKRLLGFWSVAQSPNWPMPEAALRERIRADYQRSYRPSGVLRQMRAILATGSLSNITKQIARPVNIIHGASDPLIRPKAAQILSHQIPHATLTLIEGMGHDLPEPVIPQITRAMGLEDRGLMKGA